MAQIDFPPSGQLPVIFLTSPKAEALLPPIIEVIWEQRVAAYLVVAPSHVTQVQGRA